MDFEPYLDDYKKAISQITYKQKGMFYSEGFLLVSFCRFYGIEIILESGTCQGMSTELMARSLTDTQIYTFDDGRWHDPEGCEILTETRNRLNSLKNVTALTGDGTVEIPKIIKANPVKKIAVVIDGPKGWEANDLASYCLLRTNIKFVGIHDQLFAEVLAHCEPKTCCTRDQGSFSTKYRFLDEDYLVSPDIKDKDYLKKYPKGPGLCVYYK